MNGDPTPNLLFPSCSDCDRIGLHVMPEMLRSMERDVGPDGVLAFLIAYGGREFLASASGPRANGSAAEKWMDARYPGEKVVIPKGPTAHSARLAWTIFMHLQQGWSLARISGATGCTVRTVCNRKRLFREIGFLADGPTSTNPHQETSQC